MAPLSDTRLQEISVDTGASTRPLTELEKLFSHQMAYAAWELERVRANAANVDAEARLLAAQSRANRNWNRARKQLAKLQTVRVNHATHLSPTRQEVATATPLADPARVPMPKRANNALIDQIVNRCAAGSLDLSITTLAVEQEGR